MLGLLEAVNEEPKAAQDEAISEETASSLVRSQEGKCQAAERRGSRESGGS